MGNISSSRSAAVAAAGSATPAAASTDELKASLDAIRTMEQRQCVEALNKIYIFSSMDDNKDIMGSENLGLLDLLKYLIAKYYQIPDVCMKILNVIWNLSVSPVNKTRMGSESLGLIEYLMELVQSYPFSPDVVANALTILVSISADSEAKIRMGDKALGLIEMLISIIRLDGSNSRSRSLAILQNLSTYSGNEERMCEESLKLIELLMAVIDEDKDDGRDVKGEARLKALLVLQNLSINKDNQSSMGSAKLGLVELLMAIVAEAPILDRNSIVKNLDAKIVALINLQQLSVNGDNKLRMGNDKFGLIELLITVISKDRGFPRIHALSTLQNLSNSTQNLEHMGCEGLQLIELLISVIIDNDNKIDVRYKAVYILKNISSIASNLQRMGSSKVKLFEAFIIFIQDQKQNLDALQKSLSLLINLSINSFNKVRFCSDRMVEVLLDLVSTVSLDKVARSKALTIILNLSSCPDNYASLGGASLRLIEILVSHIREDKTCENSVKAINVLLNISQNSENKMRMGIENLRFVEFLMSILLDVPDDMDIRALVLSILVNVSSTNNADNLVRLGSRSIDLVDAFIIDIVKNEESPENRIRALIFLQNITVNSINQQRLGGEKDNLKLIELMLSIIKLDGDDSNAIIMADATYQSTEARLHALLILLNLSIENTNKTRMCSGKRGPVLELLAQTIAEDGSQEIIDKCFQLIVSLSMNTDSQPILASSECQLIEVVISFLARDFTSTSDSCLRALTFFLNLSSNKGNRSRMCSKPLRLVEVLLSLLKNHESDTEFVIKILDIFKNLSSVDDQALVERLGSSPVKLLEALNDICKSEEIVATDEIKLRVFVILQNLSFNAANQERIGLDSKLNLIDIFTHIVGEAVNTKETVRSLEIRVTVLSILQNLSVNNDNKLLMASEEFLLIPKLMTIISTDKGESRSLSLAILKNLSNQPELSLLMGSKQLKLIELLQSIAQEFSKKSMLETRYKCLTILQNIAKIEDNQLRMASEEIKLVEILMKVIEEDFNAESCLKALSVLLNISCNPSTRSRLSSEPLQLVELLMNISAKVDDKSETYEKTRLVLQNVAALFD